ncbi:creatininase family protein [Nocardia cyriacigeorgica]|uniref:creatininase family protein n=1 Tax=Nocardia cyriacigeorgica TaxID=135487 RepID=UPI0018934EE1|nr:creatininase family protein [Nocardia cyriacigeorgica]MBF6399465.1 creatininase family protein [Nocardia cyriacigeorgica]MBF6405095.1 creatininase family protein [Nocardia cyriacigeorgica]
MGLITTATSTDIARAKPTIAVLPVGSFEQHGDHLPLATDTIIACLIARALADTYPLFLLPPVTISCSHEHEQFAGTLSVSHTTLTAVITDIRASLARSGITTLVLVNAHGGNYVLNNIAQEANVTGRNILIYPGRDDWNQARRAAGMDTNSHDDMHGGELETSILLHAAPELVRSSFRDSDHHAPDRQHLHLLGMNAYTSNGIIGRPSAATETKGKAALDALTRAFSDYMTLLSYP